MKCPNCRCVIPQSMVRCLYCGKYLPLGDEETEPVNPGRVPEQVYRREDGTDFHGYSYYSDMQNIRTYAKPNTKPSYEIDLSIFNDDGSLNLYKFLMIFALFDGVLLLLLLSLLLL